MTRPGRGSELIQPAASPAAAEWRAHWPLVLAAAAGFSLHSVSIYSIGLFMEPLGAEFGWGRAQISLCSLIPALLMILLSPFTGALVDRWGSRRLAIPCLALTGAALAVISLANGSIAQWLAIWVFYGFVTLGIKATVWTTAVAGTFSAARGLALGVTLCGTALTQVVIPPLTEWLIDSVGWRNAYIWLGLGWATPCLILAMVFLFDARDRERVRGSRDDAATGPSRAVAGLTFAEATRSVPLLRIAASTLLTLLIGTAVLVHQVPILTAIDVSRADAAWLASLAGVAGFIGKVTTGWMTDHWDARLVGSISLSIPTLAYLLLAQSGLAPGWYVVALLIIGYTAGTKLQICAYLTGRYAGMRNFGKIFGVMTSLIALGGSIGSVGAGMIFDHFGHYGPLLLFGSASSILCGGLLFKLGPYPDWEQ